MRDLFKELRGVPLERAAAALGLRHMGGNTWGPCPACGAEHRGRKDRRGPLGGRDGGWECHACKQDGDAAALCAHVSMQRGGPRAGSPGWSAARALAVEVGLLAPDGPSTGSWRAGAPVARPAPVAPAGAVSEAPRALPPAVEVRDLWEAAAPVSVDPEVSGWVISRGLRPDVVEELDLARALPGRGAALPGWARIGKRTWRDGWRCLLPAFGAGGDLVALRARWVRDAPPEIGSKELGGRGVSAGPAVYADPVGRWLLERGPSALAGELAGGPFGWRWSGAVVVCEGGPDWLTLAAAEARRVQGKATAAILGLWSGGWTREIGARLPPGCTVRLALHQDGAGEGYAKQVRATIPAGCRVEVL